MRSLAVLVPLAACHATTSGTADTAPTVDTDTGPPIESALVHAIGRFSGDDPPLASWSLTSYHTVVDGEDVSVELEAPGGIWFDRVVDGEVWAPPLVTTGSGVYSVASGMGPGDHQVSLVRRVEGFLGDAGLVRFIPGAGAALKESPPPYTRLIEFVGDSITAGYGVEGADQYCGFTAATENANLTYAAVAARDLDAGAVLVAYSGKGVVQNYGGDANELMPELYRRTLTNDPASAYGFDQYTPDVVVVNLGTNDFSAPLDPPRFEEGYVALLQDIRAAYPDAVILAASWSGWPAVIAAALTQLGDADAHEIQFTLDGAEGWGCDGHPSAAAHTRLGHELSAAIAGHLGWSRPRGARIP